MNKLIEELKNKTLDKHFYYTWSTMDYDDVTKFAEKFAELIVRECAYVAVFKDSGTVATATAAGHMAAGRSTAARLIKEHFGVEE